MSVSARDYAANGGANGYTVDPDGKPPPGAPASAVAGPSSNGGYPEVAKAKEEDAGTIVHSFDPNATPQEKKAQALKSAGGKVQSVDMSALKTGESNTSVGLATDMGGKSVKPTLSISDVQETSAAEGQKGDGSTMPGAIPASKSQGIPDWYKVGWASQLADREQLVDSEETRSRTILETFVSDMYYGQWYHNAAIIFFAVAASHYVTLFGGGWGALFIILATCSTYYQTSTRRVRRNIRDDMARELAHKHLFTDHETVSWMNEFLSRFWQIYEPVLSATIVASVDAVLEASTPSFLKGLRLTTFTLGNKAPRIDYIRTHPETADDEVVMDWMINFTPNDTADLKVRVAEARVNPKIVLAIELLKVAFIDAAKDIVVEDVMFKGEMRIRLKLMNNFPHIQIVDLSFLSKPDFDFVLRPVGFDLNMIPGLAGFIHSQVHATLGPMMYDPNVFTLNMEQMLAGAPIDTAAGVLHVCMYSGQGLKASKIGGGAPDPYISFNIGNHPAIDRTKTKRSTVNPHWNSHHFLLVNNLTDTLSMTVMDYNSTRRDTQLGIASFDLSSLAADASQEGLVLPVMHEGRTRGEVRFDAMYYPCLTPKKLENGEEEPVPETSTGVVRMTLHQAKDLDSKKISTNHLAVYAQFYVNEKLGHQTGTVKRTLNPVFEAYKEILISEKQDAVLGVKLCADKAGDDPMLGYVNVRLSDVLAANAKGQDWFPLAGGRTGKVRLSATWKPVLMSGAINGAGAYRPPIGVLKFWFKKGEDLKNVEALTGGRSDPYVRVMRSGIVLQRTQIHNNTLDPDFDEIVYVPIHDAKETLRLEVMDYQHLGKDRSLGATSLDVKELVVAGPDKKDMPWVPTGKRSHSEYLKLDGKNSVKGKLHFEVSFYPCTHLKFSPFETEETGIDKAKRAEASSDKASTLDESIDERAAKVEDDEMMAHLAEVAAGKVRVRAQDDSSTAGVESDDKSSSAGAEEEGRPKDDGQIDGVEMSRAELIASQSGILVFNIMSGTIAKKNARLEFLFDDGYWPAYSTEASRSTNAKWDETGEAMIRELDWSQVILKLNTAEKETREEVYAQFTTSLKSFLDDCLDQPHDFVLADLEGGNRSIVKLQCKYIPVPITLEPRESVNNMGMLTVMVDDAKGLKSADRNGYSDPYAQFILNGMKVYKTAVVKKSLNPHWGEKFEVEVPSRVHADFACEVFDWDRVGSSDKLGRARINLADLEPMQQTSMRLPLSDSSGAGQGVVNLRFTFRPGFILRSRQATSTFSSSGRVATGLGSFVHAGAGVGHEVGSVGVGALRGVGKGVSGVGRMGFSGVRKVTGAGHKRSATGTSIEDDGTLLDASPSASGAHNPTNGSVVIGEAASVISGHGGSTSNSLDGKLTVHIVSATDLNDDDAKPYCVTKHNGKTAHDTKSIKHTSAPRWDEAFTIDAASSGCILDFAVWDKKTLKDREMGSIKVDVWQYLRADNVEADLTLPFTTGKGTLNVGLSLKPREKGAASFLDTDPMPGSPARSQRSGKSRFSIHRERPPAS